MVGIVAHAQTTPDSLPDEDSAGVRPPDETTEAKPPAGPPQGDVITLMSGQVVKGQIIRQSAASYVIEVFPNVQVSITRNQVAHVTYDNYSGRGGPSGLGSGNEADKLIPGERMASELREKLIRPISGTSEPLVMAPGALAEILGALAERCQVRIDLDAAVSNTAEAKETWELTIPAGATLSDFFEDQLAKRYPTLTVQHEYSSIIVYRTPPKQPSVRLQEEQYRL
jgi:hypothetical protein